MKTVTLVDLIVRTAAGTIDEDASAEKFLAEVRQADVAGADAREAAGIAINAVFDQYKGRHLTKPVLASGAMAILGVTPENHTELAESIDSWLKANAGEGKEIMVKKGKGGGFWRASDAPVEAPKA